MRKLFLILFFFSSIILMAGAPSDLHKLLSGAGNASDYPGSSHMIVFEKTDAKVMDSGLSHVTVETLYKVLNTDGAKKLKSIFFPYDPQSAFTEVKEARVIKKCGKIIDLPVKTKDYTAPARAIYWGAREILLPVGRLEPGDGILVKTYRKGYTYALLMQEDDEKYIPPMRGHYYDIVPFYSNIPMLTKSYKVSMPVSKKVQYEFYNGEARHYVHFRGKRTEYFWEKKNILPVKGEANAVNPSDYKSKLLISTSPDWQAKSLWFNKVNEDYGSFEYSDEIKRKADEITRGAGTDMEKISRLTHWTAEEIRYSGISMGEGEGFTLHKGTMNYRDRCGVCKDIAGMLVTLLRAAGYESYPAMTMAGSRIDPIPADQFNHCVTVVKLDGKYKLLDPTWVPGVRELWSSAEQQQEYLMGVPEGAGLKSTPVSPPENHYFKFAIDSRVSPQGRLTGTIKIQAEGQSDARVRRMFSRSFIGEWQQVFEKEFYRIHPFIKITNLTYVNPYDLSKPMAITCSIAIDNYLQKGGKLTSLTAVSRNLPFARIIFSNVLKTNLKERKAPFKVRCSQWVEVRESIKLPGRFTLLTPLKADTITTKSAQFTGQTKQQGNTISISRELKLNKRIFQEEEWQDVRRCVTAFKKSETGALVIRNGGSK